MTKYDFNVEIFINNVDYFCEKRNIKTSVLEQMCGVSAGYFSRIRAKQGQKIPKMDVALAVAANLKVPLEFLAWVDFSNAVDETEQRLSEYIMELVKNTNQKSIRWENIAVERLTVDSELIDVFHDEKFALPIKYDFIGATVVPWSSQIHEDGIPFIKTLYSTKLGERTLFFIDGISMPYHLLAANWPANKDDYFYSIWLYTNGQLHRVAYAMPKKSALLFGALQTLDAAVACTAKKNEDENLAPAVEDAINDLLKDSFYQGV